MRRTVLVLALAALVIAVVPVGASAQRGGNGGGKAAPSITVSDADLSDSLRTADALGVLMVNGADHARDVPVFVAITGENSVLLRTDRSGSFGFAWSPEAEGTHTLTTYQYRNGKGWEKAASVTVEVTFGG